MRKFLGKITRVTNPVAITFAGLGGIFFHAGHGPEHLICILAGAGLALGGACWGLHNRFVRPWLARHRVLRRF